MERYQTTSTRTLRRRVAFGIVAAAVIIGTIGYARADDSVAVTAAKIEAHEKAIVDTFSLLPTDADEVAKNAALIEFLAHFDAGWAVDASECNKACWQALADDLTYDFGSVKFDSVFHDTTVKN